MDKQCFKCKETKSISEFYAHPMMGDGHLGKCKTCAKRDVAERAGRLGNNPAWLAKERARCRAKMKRYRERGLAKKYPLVAKKWQARNGYKLKAQRKAAHAVRAGKITKRDACESCGAKVKLHKHSEKSIKHVQGNHQAAMMTKEQIEQCHKEWQQVEMSDLESSHLKDERIQLYRRWFVSLIDHARQVDREKWNAGL